MEKYSKVSSHLLVERDGSVFKFVDFSKKAWHAGMSEFEGKQECNDFSIGVELEGTDTDPYSEKQYEVLIDLTDCILKIYHEITKGEVYCVFHQTFIFPCIAPRLNLANHNGLQYIILFLFIMMILASFMKPNIILLATLAVLLKGWIGITF